jgi:hypothetical protein
MTLVGAGVSKKEGDRFQSDLGEETGMQLAQTRKTENNDVSFGSESLKNRM